MNCTYLGTLATSDRSGLPQRFQVNDLICNERLPLNRLSDTVLITAKRMCGCVRLELPPSSCGTMRPLELLSKNGALIESYQAIMHIISRQSQVINSCVNDESHTGNILVR